jgi:hypothetical protein
MQEFINNKYTMCCVRILHKYGHGDNRRIMQLFEIVKFLEKIADEYKYVCDLAKDQKTLKAQPDTLRFFKSVNEYFALFYGIFYKFDPQVKEQLYKDRRRLNDEGERLLKVAKGADALMLHYLLNIVQKTYDAAGEYYAMLL